MEPAILSNLVNLGSAGAVIVVVVYLLKYKAESDRTFLDRLDRIENRHVDEERADRDQTKALFEQVRNLFDRVMGVCTDLSTTVKELSNTVKELSDSTRAHEKAIQDLRDEIRQLEGPVTAAFGPGPPRGLPGGK